MTLFTQRITTAVLTCVFTCLFIVLSKTSIRAQQNNGLYIGISSTKVGQSPVHTTPGTPYSPPSNSPITIGRGTTTYILQEGAGNYTISGFFDGGGNLEVNIGATDTLILTGLNHFQGTLTVTSGTLQIGDGGTAGATGGTSIVNNAGIVYNRSDAVDWTQAISGSGTLTKRGAGTLTLSGALSYTGTTTVEEGRLKIQDGTSPITVQNGDTLELYGTTDKRHSFSLILEDGSTLRKTNAGFNIFDHIKVSGSVTMDINCGSGGRILPLMIGHNSTGLGLRGSGTLTVKNGNAARDALVLHGTSLFQGALTVEGGGLYIGGGADSALAQSSLTLKSATLALGGTSFDFYFIPHVLTQRSDASVQSLHGDANSSILLSDRTLTVGTYGGSGGNYAGSIQGSGHFKKVGRGTQIFSGTISHTGTTRIEGGILEVTGSITSSITIAGGALSGTGTVGPVTLTDTEGSVLYGGRGLGNTGVLTIGALTLSGGALNVYAVGPRVSLVKASSVSGTVVVNLEQTISTGTHTVIEGNLLQGAQDVIPILGRNKSGSTARARWESGVGKGLLVDVGTVQAGLYQNENKLTESARYTQNIPLLGDAVFSEIIGASNVTHELSGVISGNHNITTQVDTLILTGANTYDGSTTVRSGVLQIGNNGTSGSLGKGNVALGLSAVLQFNRSNKISISNVVSGAGKLVQAGSDTLEIVSANTYSGNTEIHSGVLQLGDRASLGTGAIVNNAKLLIRNPSNVAFSKALSGSGALVKEGEGILFLTGDLDNYEGDVIVSQDTVAIQGSQNHNYRVVLGDENTGTSDLAWIDLSNSPITIPTSVKVSASGTGRVWIGSTGSVSDASYSGNMEFNRSVTLYAQTIGVKTFTGSLSGSGDVTVVGADGEIRFTGAKNTCTGQLIIANPTHKISYTQANNRANSKFGQASTTGRGKYGNEHPLAALSFRSVRVESRADFALSVSGTHRIKGLHGSGVVKASGASLELGNGDSDGDFSGVFQRLGSVIKVGSGTQIFSGNNSSYTQPVQVKGGILEVTDSLGSSVTIDGGTLRGTGTVGGVILTSSSQGLSSILYGGRGTGNTDTLDISGALEGQSGGLNVYSVGNRVSVVQAETASGQIVVNLEDAIGTDGTYTIISCTDGNSSMEATIGRNKSGKVANVFWTNNTGLQVEVGGNIQAGLYQDNTRLLTSNSVYTQNITLQPGNTNVEFTEIVGTSDITYELRGNIIGNNGIDVKVDTLILTGANRYSGETKVNYVLQIGNGSTTGTLGSGDVNLQSGSVLQFNRSDKVQVANTITGSGTLVQAGTDTLILRGPNTYSGKAEIRSGALQVGMGAASGSLGSAISPSPVINKGSLIFDLTANLSSTRPISGSGTLEQGGTGTITLSGALTYTGATKIKSGVLKINNGRSPVTVKGGATLELGGSADVTHPPSFSLNLENGSTLKKSNSVNNVFSGLVKLAGKVTVEVNGNDRYVAIGTSSAGLEGGRQDTLVIDAAATSNDVTGLVVRGTGPNHFKGTIDVEDGQLTIGDQAGATALDSAVVHLRSDGDLSLKSISGLTTAVDASIKSLTGTGDVQLSSQTLTLGTDNGKSHYGGVMSGSGGLKKVGTDTVRLTGANTCTGPTRVEKGVLEVSGSLASSVVIAGGTLSGTGTVGGATLTNTMGSVLQGGTGLGNSGELTVAGNLLLQGGSLNVYHNSGVLSEITVNANNTVTGSVVVNLEEAVVAGTYTIISSSHVASFVRAEIGRNRSTLNMRLIWVSGIGLQLQLGTYQPGLYQNSQHLTNSQTPRHVGNIALNANAVFTEFGSSPTTIYELGGDISGNFGIETQVDTLILTGTNDYTATIVTDVVLQIGKGSTQGTLGRGAVTLVDAGELHFDRSNDITIANEIKGAGKLIQKGSGTLILTGASTYTGDTRVKGGILKVSGSLASSVTIDGGTLSGTGTVGGVTLMKTSGSLLYAGTGMGNADTLTINGALTLREGVLDVYTDAGEDKFSLVKARTAFGILKVNLKERKPTADTTVIIECTGSNSLISAEIVDNNSGHRARLRWTTGIGLELLLGGATALYQDQDVLTAQPVYIQNINLVKNSIFTELTEQTTNITHELRGIISGDYGINVQLDSLILTGENTYTGTTAVIQGVLQIGKGAAGGKLGLGPVNLLAVNSELLYKHGGNTHTVVNVIGGSGKLIQAGTDTLILTGTNTYTGATTVRSGVLQIGKGAAGGKLGPGLVTLTASNSELLYKHGGNTHTVANAIGGLGKLTQAGTDTLILTGTNTYSGPTRVEKGVLNVRGSLSSSAVTVAGGGALSGTGTVSSVTLSSTAGSTIYGGNGPGNADTLKISGLLSTGLGSTLEVYSSGSAFSVVKATEISGGNLKIDLKQPISVLNAPEIITLISCTHRSSYLYGEIRVNNSGYRVRVRWTPRTGLQVVLGEATGLYLDEDLLTASTIHLTDIALVKNSVFKEIVGTPNVTHELSGIISGDGFGIETQVDTLILTGENIYTGVTKVSASSVLQIGKGAAGGKLGPGAVTLSASNSELLYKHGGDAHIVANVISGLGKLTQAGTDILVLTGASTYSGPTRVEKGVLRVTGSLSASAVTVAGGALSGTGTVSSVILNSTAGSTLYGGTGSGNADTLKISGALTGSGGALNVYSFGSGSAAKPSHVKVGSVLGTGTVTVNIEGTLPAGTHTLISCTDPGSNLTTSLGRNSSGGCVTLSWVPRTGLRAVVVSGPTATISVSGGGTAKKDEAGPTVTFTGSGGTAPYTFTYKINQGNEKTIASEGSSSTKGVTAPTSATGTFIYTLIKVRDSGPATCREQSVTGQQATVTITEEITGDLPKPGETLHIYPIPARDQIVIRSSERLGRIQLRDLQGRVLIEREPSSSREVELSVADIPPGIYMVEVEEGQNLRRVKLSKE